MASKAPSISAPKASSSGGFNAKDYVRVGLSEEEVTSIKLSFDLFDTDGGGAIDPAGTDSRLT